MYMFSTELAKGVRGAVSEMRAYFSLNYTHSSNHIKEESEIRQRAHCYESERSWENDACQCMVENRICN